VAQLATAAALVVFLLQVLIGSGGGGFHGFAQDWAIES